MNDKYRKKPVTVHAWQITQDDLSTLSAATTPITWPMWLRTAWTKGIIYRKDGSLYIKTLEGTSYSITPGYWIVQGVKGEMWPVRKDVFNETYEAVT